MNIGKYKNTLWVFNFLSSKHVRYYIVHFIQKKFDLEVETLSLFYQHCYWQFSGPHTAFAAVVEHSADSTLLQVGFAPCTQVEASPVLWVGIRAIWLVPAEFVSWDGGTWCLSGTGGGDSRSWGCGRGCCCSAYTWFLSCG